MDNFLKIILLCLVGCLPVTGFAQNGGNVSLRGTITDARTHDKLPYASILLKGESVYQSISDADGNYHFAYLPRGQYELAVSYAGYARQSVRLNITADMRHDVALVGNNRLREVVVTATESKGPVTSSRIDRSAMEFLQPTSLTDLMSLLPGGVSKDPELGAANTISLRETGTLDANGNATANQNYAISSLGTLFVVDGAPMNTDANLQYSPLSATQSAVSGTTAEDARNITNRGVDMRSISTDDIESVEVVRGIPSVEYGNLTSGMVKINKIRRETPFTARFKADGYSKLLSLGKGIRLGDGLLLNIDAGMLDAKPDPTNNLENYRRANASLRLTVERKTHGYLFRYLSTTDYTGSFDNSKSDPDLNYGRIDEYKSTYNRIAFTNNFILRPDGRRGWLESIELNTSVSQQVDKLTQRRLVAPQRYGIVPTSFDEGVHDAHIVFSEYMADYLSDGKPFSAYAKLKTSLAVDKRTVANRLLAGIEWTCTKNFGRGQVYDLTRPLSVSGWGARPRAYRDIPAMQQFSAFVEYRGTLKAGQHELNLQAGVRTNSLLGLDDRYDMKGNVYFDPRANLQWRLPAVETAAGDLRFSLSGGVGRTTKMPTLNYLYPDKHYNDITELGYYDTDNPQEHSRFVVRSYIQDPTNYNLRPAVNLKKEVRLDVSFAGNELSVGYFHEDMTSGFRYMAIYAPYAYNDYDESAVESDKLTSVPSLEGLPYEERKKLDGYTQSSNGSRLVKEGVEFQFSSVRIRPLRTRIHLNGAWFRSTYTNSLPMFSTVAEVVDNIVIQDRYVGLYDWNDGNINQTLNTNLMLDTQIPEWGLIFATSVQCMWFVKTQTMERNGVPMAYMDVADGQLHPYDDVARQDHLLMHLVKYYNEASFEQQTIPFAMNINLKATKRIGDFMKISFFANKIIDYTPDYYSNGYLIRRNVSPYFGIEASFTL